VRDVRKASNHTPGYLFTFASEDSRFAVFFNPCEFFSGKDFIPI
jgi:hypothetical protein